MDEIIKKLKMGKINLHLRHSLNFVHTKYCLHFQFIQGYNHDQSQSDT